MKKIISQILIILAIMLIGTLSVFIEEVNADSVAGINCPSSVNLEDNFTVSLILPENAVAAQATITVKFSNGTTETKMMSYSKGMESEYGMVNGVTFKASVNGSVLVSVSNIHISDRSGNFIEKGGSKTASLNIVGTPSTSTSSNNNNSSSNNDNNSNSSNSNNNQTPQAKFTDVNETVYTTDVCNIRKNYSTSSDKIATVKSGTALKRTGVGDNGWSRIEYNGQVAYITSQYLSSTAPEVNFSNVNETLYAKQDCNVRKSYSTDSEKVGYLTAGQEVTRIGIGENGWSKIKYNGQEYYVASNLLSKDEPTEDDNTVNNTIDNNTINNTNVVTNEMVEGNKTPLELVQEEIGVIPEVGNNIAIKIYIVITALAIMATSVGIYYLKFNKRK